jgi:hypothetical protein
MKLGEKLFSHWDWGRYSAHKKHSREITASILTPFSELLPNLYYSPIKKLENIFIFKIAGKIPNSGMIKLFVKTG